MDNTNIFHNKAIVGTIFHLKYKAIEQKATFGEETDQGVLIRRIRARTNLMHAHARRSNLIFTLFTFHSLR